MALNDIYKIDLLSEWNFDEVVDMRTTFYYQCLSSVATAANRAAEALVEDILPEMVICAPEHVIFNQVDAVCLVNPTDYHSINLAATPGTRVPGIEDDPAASFLCVQLVSNRAGPGTRSGRKRFSWLYEGDIVGNNVVPDAAFQLALENLQLVMANTMEAGSIIFAPVVVKHPTPLGVQPIVRYTISVYNLSERLSTQDTRKR